MQNYGTNILIESRQIKNAKKKKKKKTHTYENCNIYNYIVHKTIIIDKYIFTRLPFKELINFKTPMSI